MATKSDFTEDEWATLQRGVTGAGMLVSVGDRDFTDSFGEASALAKFLATQQQENENPFIRELASIRGTGFGVTDSPAEIEEKTMSAIGASVETLAAKAPDDLVAYRELVLAAADAVAKAKGDVAPGETAAIARIEAALGNA